MSKSWPAGNCGIANGWAPGHAPRMEQKVNMAGKQAVQCLRWGGRGQGKPAHARPTWVEINVWT